MHIEVETQNVDGQVTALLGSAGPFTLVVDRPVERGGGGLGFNGGQLLYLAVAGCISNDLFRDARAASIKLSRVRVKVGGDFVGEPAVSDEIRYEVEVSGDAPEDRLRALIDQVDEIAEIPELAQARNARAFSRSEGGPCPVVRGSSVRTWKVWIRALDPYRITDILQHGSYHRVIS